MRLSVALRKIPRCSRDRGTFLKLLELLSELSLGFMLILSWGLILSTLGVTCPALDGSLVTKAILIPLTSEGLILWLVVLGALLFKLRKIYVLALVIVAPFVFAGFPEALVLASLLLALLWAREKGITQVLRALLASAVVVELGSFLYALGRIGGVDLPLLPIFPPLFLSLYSWLVPLAPPIVFTLCLAPLFSIKRISKKPLSVPKAFSYLRPRLGLLAGLALSLLYWYAIYYSSLNPSGKLVGVDPVTRYYPHILKILKNPNPIKGALSVGYDRPAYYLFLLFLAELLNPILAVKVLPLTCMLLYTFAVYLWAREFIGKRSAGVASLLSMASYTTTTGLFGGLYSNWTSLSIAILASIAFKRLFERSRLWLLAFLVLVGLSIALHVYMGVVTVATFALTVLLLLPLRKYRKTSSILLVLGLLSGVAGFLALRRFPGIMRIIVSNTRMWFRNISRLTLSGTLFSPKWWSVFSFAVYNYAVTSSLDLIGWILAIIGILAVEKRSIRGLLLLSWLIVVSVLALFAPFNLIYRSMYDYPLVLLETLGLMFLLSRVEDRIGGKTSALTLMAILGFKLAFTLNYVVGLVLTA